MTTLANRASPSQSRIMRAVSGAVKNVADVHPDWKVHPRLAGSVAKRAAGTLTAEWPDVLAARLARRQERKFGHLLLPTPRRRPTHIGPVRPPLKSLWARLTREVGPAKHAGQTERAETLIYVLRMIAKMQEQSL